MIWQFTDEIAVQHVSKSVSNTGARQTSYDPPGPIILCKPVPKKTTVRDTVLGRTAMKVYQNTCAPCEDVREGDQALYDDGEGPAYYIVREVQVVTKLQAGPGAKFLTFEMWFKNLAPGQVTP
jgi:hypothetical protein